MPAVARKRNRPQRLCVCPFFSSGSDAIFFSPADHSLERIFNVCFHTHNSIFWCFEFVRDLASKSRPNSKRNQQWGMGVEKPSKISPRLCNTENYAEKTTGKKEVPPQCFMCVFLVLQRTYFSKSVEWSR